MPGPKPHRQTAGPKWNEGARLLWAWLRKMKGEVSQRELGRRLGCKDGAIVRVLYGDRLPGRDLGNAIERETGVKSELFSQPAKKPFEQPVARAA